MKTTAIAVQKAKFALLLTLSPPELDLVPSLLSTFPASRTQWPKTAWDDPTTNLGIALWLYLFSATSHPRIAAKASPATKTLPASQR